MSVTEFTKAYQTSDGSVFVDKAEAEKHDREVRIQKFIRMVLEKHYYPDWARGMPGMGLVVCAVAAALVEAGFNPPEIEHDSSEWTGRK